MTGVMGGIVVFRSKHPISGRHALISSRSQSSSHRCCPRRRAASRRHREAPLPDWPGHRRAGLVQGRKLAVTEADIAVDTFLKGICRLCCRRRRGCRRKPSTTRSGSRVGWSGSSIPSTAPEPSRAGIPIGRSRSGLVHEGRPVLGVVHAPVHERLYEATRGVGAFCNGIRLSASVTADPCAWPGQSPLSSGSSVITARSSICRKFRRWRSVSSGSPRAPSTLAWYLPDRRIGILQPPISSSGKPGLFFRTFQRRPLQPSSAEAWRNACRWGMVASAGHRGHESLNFGPSTTAIHLSTSCRDV